MKLIILSNLFVIGATRLNEVWVYTPDSGQGYPVAESLQSVTYAKHLNVYGLDISLLTYQTFYVQACNDAFIYLSESYNLNPNKKHYYYVIGAGGGKNISPRRIPKHPGPRDIYITKRLSTPTKCDSLKLFWIYWGNGNLTIGEIVNSGTKTSATLIDPEPFPVRSLGVATHYGATGTWKFYVKATGHFCLNPHTKGNMDQLFTMYRVYSSYQCAMACEHIQMCMGFNYKESDSLCQLIQTGKAEVTTYVQGWTYYTKCFNGVCLACF